MTLTRFHDLTVGQAFTWEYGQTARIYLKLDSRHYQDDLGYSYSVGSANAHAMPTNRQFTTANQAV